MCTEHNNLIRRASTIGGGLQSCSRFPAMTYQVDLHVHTRLGSLDSAADPAEVVRVAAARGIAAVGVTEHYRVWGPGEVRQYSRAGVAILAGIEITTDEGHFLVFGVERAPRGRTLVALAEEVDAAGGAIIVAHPFRGHLDHWKRASLDTGFHPELAALATHGWVHAIEAWNNGCTESENDLALGLAYSCGLPAVAGSDAHVATDVGRQTTRLDSLPRDGHELAAMLRCRAREARSRLHKESAAG